MLHTNKLFSSLPLNLSSPNFIQIPLTSYLDAHLLLHLPYSGSTRLLCTLKSLPLSTIMELDELKSELALCTEKEQDTLASYLLYLRLKRNPKDVEGLYHKVSDPSLDSWSEELFKPQK